MSYIVVGYEIDAEGRRWPVRRDQGAAVARTTGALRGQSGRGMPHVAGELVVAPSEAELARAAQRAYVARQREGATA